MSDENIRLAFIVSPLLHPDLHATLSKLKSRQRGKYLAHLADRALAGIASPSVSPIQVPGAESNKSSDKSNKSLGPVNAAPANPAPVFDDATVGQTLDKGLTDAILDY